MVRIFKTLIAAAIIPVMAASQVPQDPTYGMTPNAKSIQRYGDIPVSLYTGTPNIEIPLDTINDVSHSLTLALSYHSGGIKADEHPGWVGLGWSLQCGGIITRELRDMPDEYDFNRKYGYYYSHNYLKNDEFWEHPDDDKVDGYISSLSQIMNAYDTEPDKFSFSFPGYSGFFMLDADGTWRIHSARQLKVKNLEIGDAPLIAGKQSQSQSRIIRSFTLTAEDGTDYVFGEDAVELTINFRLQQTSGWSVSAWHLKRIVHPNGDAIKFQYNRGDYVVNMSYCDEIKSVISRKGSDFEYVSSRGYNGSLMSPVYLSSIIGNTFTVSFNSSESDELDYEKRYYQDLFHNDFLPIYFMESDIYTGDVDSYIKKIRWRKLNSIICSNANGQVLRQFKFGYIENRRTRLSLNGISVCDRFGNSVASYRFAYNKLQDMPPYLSLQTDHWGYYNGDNNSNPQEERNPNVETLMYGTLKEITYPYGGKTIFEFEPHTYSKIVHKYEFGDMNDVPEAVTGGVRIKRITDIPMDSTVVHTREFRYTMNYGESGYSGVSSGILEGYPTYSAYIPITDKSGVTEGSSVSLSHIVNSSGLHICYPEAVEIHDDGGYEIHRFTSCLDPDYCDQPPLIYSIPARFVPVSSLSHLRGLPLSDKYFDSDGHILRSTQYEYEKTVSDKGFAPAIHNFFNAYQGVSFYKNYTYSLVVTKKTDNLYETGLDKCMTMVSFRKYNRYAQLKTDSTEVKRGGGSYVSISRYEYCWEKDARYESSFFIDRIGTIARSRNNLLLEKLSMLYLFRDGVPYVSQVLSQKGASDIHQEYECAIVNRKGAPVAVRYRDFVPVIYLWSKDYLHPVAVLRGGEYSDIAGALGFSPELAPDHSRVIENRISDMRLQFPSYEITEYNYTPHIGVTAMIDPSGKTTYYDYDLCGRLTSISDTKKDLVSAYDYSCATTDNPASFADSVRNYLDSHITIKGPDVINPDSTRYYWADIEDIGLPYRWEISGDSSVATMHMDGKYLRLTPARGWNLGAMSELKLSVFDNDGTCLWSKSRAIVLRKPFFNILIEKAFDADEETAFSVIVRPIDTNIVIDHVHLFVNSVFVKTIDDHTDKQTGAGPNGVRGVVRLRRDDNADFYQIMVTTDERTDSWILDKVDLFPSR